MSKVHEFKQSFTEGEKGEAFLDDFFRRTYPDVFISDVDMRMQMKGIDRIFDNGNRQWKVEYKTDAMAKKTGNMYLELTVHHKPPKLGWTIGSQADALVYYIPEVCIYMVSFALLRSNLEKYYTSLKRRVVWNKSKHDDTRFSSFGLLLPLTRFEKDNNPRTWRF